jgi:uncharacterized membrane protein YhaH (DUF805 family)
MLFALFSWGGRMGRLAYFGYSILLSVMLVVLNLVLLLPLRNAPDAKGITIAITLILGAMGIWGGFCLAAKRLHDVDLSAWYYVWIILIPALLNGVGVAMRHPEVGMTVPGLVVSLAGLTFLLLVYLILLFWPGTDGTNRYGERY